MGKRICDEGGEGMFLSSFGTTARPDISLGIGFGLVMIYLFLGVAIISDIFMNSIETVTAWKKTVMSKETGSSAPEIFLATIETFKRGFHSGDLGPSTIVGSAAFNLFSIIAVCVGVIPAKENRVVANTSAFLVTAFFSVCAYFWMVVVLVFHTKDVVDLSEAILTFFYLPALVWVSYSVDVGILSRWLQKFWPEAEEKEVPLDKLHCISFPSDAISIPGRPEEHEIEVVVLRKGGLRHPVSFTYRTERSTAVPGYDFDEKTGVIELDDGQDKAVLKLQMPAKLATRVQRDFFIILEAGEGEVDFDPNDDGGKESAILTVSIEPIPGSTSRHLDYLCNINGLSYAFQEWADQFVSACYCNGSREEQADASLLDWVFHIVSLPWKVFFSCVPPASFFGGWLCFCSAILSIGLCTAFISDVAEMFGCVLDVPDIVTATTFVALGTSMPDLFASLSAAVGDTTADASIVNVTGSNSVNVFLGLGVPWTAGTIYWRARGRNAEWEERYPDIAVDPQYEGMAVFVVVADNLGFSVMIFSLFCLIALSLLAFRRRFLGGELGGPFVPKLLSVSLLAWLWIAFVSLTSWRTLRCGKDDQTWCIAAAGEQVGVLGGIMCFTVLLAIPALASTRLYQKQALVEIAEVERTRQVSRVWSGRSSRNSGSETTKVLEKKENGQDCPEAEEVPKTALTPLDGKHERQEELRVTAMPETPVAAELALEDLHQTIVKQKSFDKYLDLNLDEMGKKNSLDSARGEQHKPSHLPSAAARIHTVVSVIVVAYHPTGRAEAIFQIKMLTPLSKVMTAWCNEHKLDINTAVFKVRKKEIRPSDTLASLSYDPAKGPFVLRAFPRRSDATTMGNCESDPRYDDEDEIGMDGVERGIV